MPQKKGREAAPETESSTTAPEVPSKLLKDIDPAIAATPAAAKPSKKTKTANQTEETPQEVKTSTAAAKTTNLDDQDTDAAVNDIAVDEADTMLILQDVANDMEDEDHAHHKKEWVDAILLLILVIVLGAVIVLQWHEILDAYHQFVG